MSTPPPSRLTPGTGSPAVYLAILRRPGVALPVLGTALASLPIGMLGLAVLLLIEHSRGGFTAAGGVVALLGLGTGIGIAVQGRLMDCFGCPRVLLTAVSVQGLSLLALVAVLHNDGGYGLVGAAAFVAGLGEPQVGGCLRALWPALVAPHQRLSAAALSSIVFEVPVLAGPLVLAAALLVCPAEVTLLLAGAFFLGGAGILAASGAARRWSPVPRQAPGILGPLVSARLRRVLVVGAVQGGVVGLLQVSCAAFAAEHGRAAVAGVLYATLSIGSLLGTFGYGLRRWPGAYRSQVAVLTGLLVGVLAIAAYAPTIAVLGCCVLLIGLLLGPVAVCCFVEAEQSAPAGTAIGAFTSLTAVGLGGTAGGTAVAGALVDGSGTATALLTAAALTVVATLAMTVRTGVRGACASGSR